MSRVARSKVRKRIRTRKAHELTQRAAQAVPSGRRAFIELSDDYKWIEIWFPYSMGINYEITETIPGAHFKDRNQGGPKWRVPRDIETCNQLRAIFGPTEFYQDPETGEETHIRGLWIGDALRAWARQQLQLERNLHELASAKDAKLKKLPKDSRIARGIAGEPIPELDLPPLPNGDPNPLMIERDPRPYQRADIKVMAMSNVLNANQPGTGKTIETIGSWVESNAINEGPILVVSPVSSLEPTWLKEILRWLGDRDDVFVYTDAKPNYRKQQVELFLDQYENDKLEGSSILCLNYEWFRLVMTHKKGTPIVTNIGRCIGRKLDSSDVHVDEEDPESFGRAFQVRKERQNAVLEELGLDYDPDWDEEDRLNKIATTIHAKRDHKGNHYGYANELQRRLLAVEWAAVTIDEFHKSGLNNRLTLFSQGAELIIAALKSALSGTPMGGKPRKLWPVFHWLDPEEFSAEWNWINRWLDTQAGRSARSKIVGGLKEGIEEKFGKAHARHLIRRTKLSALPGLPPRIEQVVWSRMSATQDKQYREFQMNLEIKIEEERLSANNILTEYLRLKQFANAKQRMVEGTPYPTEDSGKLDDLWEKLDENGMRPLKDDPEPGARAIIGSESSRMVFMIVEWLRKKGIAADALVGGVDAAPIIDRFKRGNEEPYIIVMTVQTGGVSLDLEEAQSMHAIDETWNPDDIEQFFERGDRGTRTTALNCYIYRTRDTIQEYIAEVNEGKAVTNDTVLKIRQRIHDAEDIEM